MAARWTLEQDLLLRRLYAEGLSRAEIAAHVGRSEYAIDARRRGLGIAARPRYRPWTELEDRLVRASATAGLPAFELAARLGRPVDAIWRRRRRLGVAGVAARRYTAGEDERLRRAVARGEDLGTIAAALGRSRAAAALRARELGLVQPRERRRWLADEDATVRQGYERGLTCAAIGASLSPPRSAAAVAAHARVLGVTNYGRSWTLAEDGRLRELVAARVPVEEAARALIRTPEAVRQRSRALGLKLRPVPRQRAFERWTKRDDAILRRHAASDVAALVALLGRSDIAVLRRMRALGLRSSQARTPHRSSAATGLTPAELELARRECAAGGCRRLFALARRFGYTPAELKRLLDERAVALAS
jgi:hypothetical protein